jgi:large subunit ribosomal protein L3
MKFIIAKKIKMTQLPDPEMGFVPVTVLEASPAIISQIRTKEKDGYTAVQIAANENKHLTKAQIGHLKKAFKENEVKNLKNLKEFRMDDVSNYNVGDIIDLKQFSPGELVNIEGLSKGKGFQGVVKR